MFKWFEQAEDTLFTGSRTMAPPWGPVLRIVRYPAALLRDWMRGEISVRAMSLAYTTLLSIVPLLVFSFAILRRIGARGDLRFILEQFFAPLGGASEQLTESVLQFVRNMRGDLLGAIGLVFLIYTVVTTIQKVETSFNFLWRVDHPRSFLRRFTEYLAVMTLGPVFLAVAIGLLTGAENSPFAQWVDGIEPLAWTLSTVGKILPYVIVAAIFTFMYVFIPNTKVQFSAALIGGITSGIVWALVGKLFTAVIVNSSSRVAIYTGFAIVLTTLIWVYVSWLIMLLGAQFAFYLQFPQYLRHGQDSFELTGRDREQVALSIMYLIGRDFSEGKSTWSPRSLAAELDIPSIAMAPILHCLEAKGLILATEGGRFVPGRDIAAIELSEIYAVVRALHSGRLAVAIRSVGPAVELLKEVEAAMAQSLKHRTLKDLVTAQA